MPKISPIPITKTAISTSFLVKNEQTYTHFHLLVEPDRLGPVTSTENEGIKKV